MDGWRTRGTETLFSHSLFDLERRTLVRTAQAGAEGGQEAVDEERQALVLGSRDWVHVIPVLPDDRLLLVRQWRYASASFHLELPGGIVEAGEDERVSAERELLEETGYRAGTWRRLGDLDPNPAILDNRLGIWLATDLEWVEEPRGDGDEEIEVLTVPLEEIPRWVERGEIRHALMLSSLYLYQLDRLRSGPEPAEH